MPSDPPVEYKLKVTKQARRLSLRYDHRGLRIISPRKLSDEQAQALISKHHDWIAQQRHFFAPRTNLLGDGSEMTIFGDSEIIRYQTGEKTKVTEAGEFLIVTAPPGEHDKALHAWLRKVARKGIIARVEEIAAKYQFKYNNVAVRDQTSRWGSCSTDRNLNFSWRLMLAPMTVMDYVIVHELAHTQQMNHSRAFWTIVEKCMPDYKTPRKWLKREGTNLHQY